MLAFALSAIVVTSPRFSASLSVNLWEQKRLVNFRQEIDSQCHNQMAAGLHPRGEGIISSPPKAA
jgi:hypothetical protein